MVSSSGGETCVNCKFMCIIMILLFLEIDNWYVAGYWIGGNTKRVKSKAGADFRTRVQEKKSGRLLLKSG